MENGLNCDGLIDSVEVATLTEDKRECNVQGWIDQYLVMFWEPNISGLYIVCFMDLAIFVVELLICEHNSPEVVEA